MKYLLLLLSFNAFGNCDLYKGSEIRTEMCYYVPLTFVKCELMDEFRDPEKYPNSVWVKDPRDRQIPSNFYLTTIINGEEIKYDD